MSDDLREAIADRLRLARENAGLSQGQAARQLSIHRPTISEIEAGRRKVSAEELVSFSELYDVSTAWVLEGTAEEGDADLRVRMAARELGRMKPSEVKKVLQLISSVKKEEG